MGLIAGTFVCLMGVTGTIVTFRPQIANLISPAAVSTNGCTEATDWNRAQQEIQSYTHSTINRLYFPDGSDPRIQMRIMADAGVNPKVYRHITFDGCAAKILGETNLGWMYWMVDLHHNLLAENVGRRWAGVIGVVLLISAVGGLLLWLLAHPDLRTIFRVRTGRSPLRVSMDLHRSVGLAALPLLILPAFTGIWLCYQQPLRAMLSSVMPVTADARAPRPQGEAPTTLAGLADIIQAARVAVPNGHIREIRMPEGYGNVQVRMWRDGDFRSLGNNVVTVDSVDAKVLLVDLYAGKPSGNRFIQALAGLHYGEWERRAVHAPSRAPVITPGHVTIAN